MISNVQQPPVSAECEPKRTPGQAEGTVEDVDAELRQRGLAADVESAVDGPECCPAWCDPEAEPSRTPGTAEGEDTDEANPPVETRSTGAEAGVRHKLGEQAAVGADHVGQIPDPNNVDG